MDVRVLPMRRRGRRVKHSDWINQRAVAGALSMAELSTQHGHVRYACLLSAGGLPERLLPDLFEPALVNLGSWILVLRGYERCDGQDGRFSVVQEWHCTISVAR